MSANIGMCLQTIMRKCIKNTVCVVIRVGNVSYIQHRIHPSMHSTLQPPLMTDTCRLSGPAIKNYLNNFDFVFTI